MEAHVFSDPVPLKVNAETVFQVREKALAQGNAGLKQFETETKARMEAEQPELFKFLSGISELTPQPKSFALGSLIAFAVIPEEEINARITQKELEDVNKEVYKRHSIRKDPSGGLEKMTIDFRELEKKLQKDAPSLLSLIKEVQKAQEQKNPQAGYAFYYGAMFTLFPFFRRIDQLRELDSFLAKMSPDMASPPRSK